MAPDGVASDGSELMFIYGEYDPWTMGEFDLDDAVDSYKYTVARANHGASILDLDASARSDALAILEGWTGVTLVIPDSKAAIGAKVPRLLPPVRMFHRLR